MKLISLEMLERYNEKIQALIEAAKNAKQTVSYDDLPDNVKDAVAKAETAVQDDDIKEIEDTISNLEEIINGNKEAIEAASTKTGTLEKSLADAVTNISNAEEELADVKESLKDIDTSIGTLNISKENAAEEIAALKKRADENDSNVSALSDSLTTTKTALETDIAQIKTDLGAVDGLADIQQKVQDIETIVEDLEKEDLTSYVKKTELEDSIETEIVSLGVIDGDTKQVNFYTKTEAADMVDTTLAEYVKNDDLSTTLTNYYTKTETPEVVKTQMLSANLLAETEDGDFETNVYTKSETAAAVAESLTAYTNNTLTNYATKAYTSDAISQAVGDLNMNQYSTVTQTAGAIETAIADFDDNNIKKKYYDKEETATYVSSQMNSYVDGKLEDYSTTEQTAKDIASAVAAVDVSGQLTNYSTKEQTATAITDTLYSKGLTGTDGARRVITADEAATQITSSLGNYTTKSYVDQQDDAIKTYVGTTVDSKLTNYSTTTQTADALTAELKSLGLTDSSGARAVLTASEASTQITSSLNGYATTSYVDQKASGVTSTVEAYTDNKLENYSTISQTADQIALCVKSADLTGDNIVSKINLASDGVEINGAHIHITGDTTFDDDVIIKGNMTAGTVSCDSGVAISAGAVSMNDSGMKLTCSSGATVTFDSNGMSFTDSNGTSFSTLGRFKAGTCKDGETVSLGWDVAPKQVLLTPYSIQSAAAGYTAQNIYTKCYADNISASGFTAHIYTTLSSGSYYTATTASKTNTTAVTWYNKTSKKDVTVNGDTLTYSAPSGATQTTLSIPVSVSGFFGYAASGDDSSWGDVGMKAIYLDVFANGTLTKSETLASNSSAPTSPNSYSFTATSTVTHDSGASIGFRVRVVYSVEDYFYDGSAAYITTKMDAGTLTCNVVGDSKLATGTATYLALG